MQSIAETCVRFDAAHLSINLVSEIAVPMFTTLIATSRICLFLFHHLLSTNIAYFEMLTTNKVIIR